MAKTIYNISVPNSQYYSCKNLIAVMYDLERPKHFNITDAQFEHKLSALIKQKYKAEKQTKSLYDVLKELRNIQREKGSLL